MDIALGEINYLAVVVGVLLNMAGGALWYSPVLFANPWMAANGFTKKEIEAKGGAAKGYVVSVVASIVITLVLAVIVEAAEADKALHGLALGLLAGLGFVATTAAANYAFEDRPLKLYFINIGYPVVMFAVIGTLLAA